MSDITPLAGLTNLTYLDLDENLISDITPLAGLTGLVSLDLVHNRILDASPLAGLTNLTESLGDENIQGLIDGQRVPLDDIAVGTPYKIPVVTQVDGSIVPVEVGSDGGTITDGYVTWSAAAGDNGALTWFSVITINGMDIRFTGQMDQNIFPAVEPPAHPDRVVLRSGNRFEVTRPDAASTTISYGKANDDVFFGDWTNAGTDGITVRRGNTFYVKDVIGSGTADRSIVYGRPGDEVLVGDWDGDGIDTFAIRRGNTFYVKNTISSGVADTTIVYGRPGDEVLVGDWDGDGIDTFAVRRGNTFFIKNAINAGAADETIVYGRVGDEVLVGDWDADGIDTFIVRRGNTFFVKNTIGAGPADEVRVLGTGDELAYAAYID